MTYYYNLISYCEENNIPCQELEPTEFELTKVRCFRDMGSLEDMTSLMQMLLYISNPYFKERLDDYNDVFSELVDMYNKYRRR